MDAVFYVMEYETGLELGEDVCGCINEFSTYKQALKLCKKVSKKFPEDKFTISCMVPSTCYVNGKEEDDL